MMRQLLVPTLIKISMLDSALMANGVRFQGKQYRYPLEAKANMLLSISTGKFLSGMKTNKYGICSLVGIGLSGLLLAMMAPFG